MSRSSKKRISTESTETFGEGLGGKLGDFGATLQGLPAKPQPKKQVQQVASVRKKAASKGRVEVRREKAGRGGKTVTTLKAFPANIPLRDLEAMTFELKKTCACGGTLKGRNIELQGDVGERVLEELERRGYKPVKAGG